jgi:hypothetical protein
MSTATGTLTQVSPSKWRATFIIDEQLYDFAASINPDVPKFAPIDGVKLTYANIDQLTGTHAYGGTWGPTSFKLTLDNIPDPPVISGTIDTTPNSVDGNGVWDVTFGI